MGKKGYFDCISIYKAPAQNPSCCKITTAIALSISYSPFFPVALLTWTEPNVNANAFKASPKQFCMLHFILNLFFKWR